MQLLFLNSIGTSEMILILFVILMLFGSKGLPGFARNIGRGMREIRDASNEIKRDIQNSAIEMRKDLNTENLVENLLEDDGKKKEENDQPDSMNEEKNENSITKNQAS